MIPPLRRGAGRVLAALVILTAGACEQQESAAEQGRRSTASDSMGVRAREIRRIRLRAHPDLVESSAAVMSATQPGVLFTINDSGNDPLLFAVDTTGADRGVWRLLGATNIDWEAAALGPCAESGAACIYIGDVGDNFESLPERVIYRVREPPVGRKGYSADIAAEKLTFRYSDGPHDVEAMYVAPNGSVILITKRRRKDDAGRLRPALVFTLPATAWKQSALAVAELTDSLPIVPGSAPMRTITDAALSPDARYLAVRTYGQVFVFAVDSSTGRVRHDVATATCNLAKVQERPGEGITWVGTADRFLLTSEGRKAPMQIVRCPVPRPR